MPVVGKGEAKGFHFTLGAVFGILMSIKWFNQICVLIKRNRSVDQRLQDYTPLKRTRGGMQRSDEKSFYMTSIY